MYVYRISFWATEDIINFCLWDSLFCALFIITGWTGSEEKMVEHDIYNRVPFIPKGVEFCDQL